MRWPWALCGQGWTDFVTLSDIWLPAQGWSCLNSGWILAPDPAPGHLNTAGLLPAHLAHVNTAPCCCNGLLRAQCAPPTPSKGHLKNVDLAPALTPVPSKRDLYVVKIN